jgi:hypothetical protein
LLDEIVLQSVGIKGDITYWTIGRVMMICLGSRKPLVLYEHITKKLQWSPSWKSFAEKVFIGDSKDAYVAQALQIAFQDTYATNWRLAGYMSPQSFVHLLEHFLLMISYSPGIFITTRSCFVGWFTFFYSAAASTRTSPLTRQKIPDDAVSFIVGICQQVLYVKVVTVSWIQQAEIKPSNYHPLLALKLVMILSLVCLQVAQCSQVLLGFLVGKNNIANLLPKQFVHNIQRRRKGRSLNLSPEVFAEAFKSIDDPLLIVCVGDVSHRKIHAPCTIFVNIWKSKEEIMSLLFPPKNTHNGRTSSNNVGVETICDSPSMKTLPDDNLSVNPVDVCKLEPRMNWKFLDEISDHISGKKG